MDLETGIYQILRKHKLSLKKREEVIIELLDLFSNYLQLKDKKIKDLSNWAKSDLAQETNVKLTKTQTPYRIEKIRFLRKMEDILNL